MCSCASHVLHATALAKAERGWGMCKAQCTHACSAMAAPVADALSMCMRGLRTTTAAWVLLLAFAPGTLLHPWHAHMLLPLAKCKAQMYCPLTWCYGWPWRLKWILGLIRRIWRRGRSGRAHGRAGLDAMKLEASQKRLQQYDRYSGSAAGPHCCSARSRASIGHVPRMLVG